MSRISQCMKALENGDIKKAYKILEEVKRSGIDEEKLALAEQLSSLGFLEEAQVLYKNLLETYPDEGELLIALAENYINLDQEQEAILTLEKIKEGDPCYLESLVLQADLYQLQGLYEVSISKLKKAEQLAPDEPAIQFGLAEMYFETGRLHEAAYLYEKVLEYGKTFGSTNVYERIASVYSAAGEFEKALDYYERALEGRLDINILFGYGLTAYQANYFKKAIEKLSEVIELDPDYEGAYLPLAKAHEQENEIKEALEIIERGLEVNSINKDFLYYAGMLAGKNGEVGKAEEYFQKALQIDPTFIDCLLAYNQLLYSEERYDVSLPFVEEALAEGEEDPFLMWDYAVLCQKNERYSDALKAYQKAYSYFKNHEEFLQDYGFFLLEEGNYKEAIEIFNQLRQIDPTNMEYVDILERLEADE